MWHLRRPCLVLILLNEGDEYSLTIGEVVDPGADTVVSYIVDWGDGETTTILEADLNAAGRKLTHKYADDGTREIKLSLVDEDGTSANDMTKVVTVNNVAPVTTISGDSAIAEGTGYFLTIGAVVDPGDDSIVTYKIDWGDGEISEIAAAALPADRVVEHKYIDDYVGDIKLTLVDEDGEYSAVALTGITVTNVDPDIEMQAGGGMLMQSVAFSQVVELIDAGSNDILELFVDYGDGGIQKIALGTLRQAVLNKAFTVPGDYTVTLYVKDDDGGVSSKYSFSIKVMALPVSGETQDFAEEDEDVEDRVLPENYSLSRFELVGAEEPVEDATENSALDILIENMEEMNGNKMVTPVGGGQATGLSGLTGIGTVAAAANSLRRVNLIDISDIVEHETKSSTRFIDDMESGQNDLLRVDGNAGSNVSREQTGDSVVPSRHESLISTDESNVARMRSGDLLLSKMQEIVAAQQQLVANHESRVTDSVVFNVPQPQQSVQL